MMNFLPDHFQQRQISEAKADASKAKQEVFRYTERIKELEFSLQRMTRASEAMWELLKARLDITESELIAKMNEIDLRDGTEEQQRSLRVTTCPKCNRTISAKTPRCIYCGTDVPTPHLFQ
jgi:phage-related minor tail protein